MKFNCVFSNPPYTRNVDLKILEKVLPICEEAIVVHPASWFFTSKPSRLISSLPLPKTSYMFNGNSMFSIALFSPCAINHFVIGHDHDCLINERYRVTKREDITPHGEKYMLVKPLRETLQKHINEHGHVGDIVIGGTLEERLTRIATFEPNILQYSAVKGNITHKLLQYSMVKGHVSNDNPNLDKLHIGHADFFAFGPKSRALFKQLRNKKYAKGVIGFDTTLERDNFIEYSRTKFFRFCLSLRKYNQNIYRHDLNLVPLLDFTRTWTDDALFEHFNVSDELREYILEFIPDWYEEDK